MTHNMLVCQKGTTSVWDLLLDMLTRLKPVCFHKRYYCAQRPPYFAVAIVHNILEVAERLFTARVISSSLSSDVVV